MIKVLTDMYITILPVIAAGILNMLFTKTKIYEKYRYPIDGNKVMSDGKRVFGENKTWAGFAGMIIFNALSQLIIGFVYKNTGLDARCDYYNIYDVSVLYCLISGALSGFIYMICELPNSFIKRRTGIKAGKTDSGLKGIIFFIIDQFDSIIGLGILLGILSGISSFKAFGYVLLGGFTHIAVNLVLYRLKIRKNI